jgi:hypothetical protein
MKYFSLKVNRKKEKGFALLFAVLVGSLVVTMGMAIATIAIKELMLSAIAREAQYSFYAADTALECALYLDYKGDGGDGKEVFLSYSHQILPNTVTTPCAGQTITLTSLSSEFGSTDAYKTKMTVSGIVNGGISPGSATVIIEKKDETNLRTITVRSYGYNTSETNSILRVERALEVKYTETI